jgi:phosphoglycerate dehydrogenase-like enzyme
VIAVLGAAGTIGRTVAGFLESWGVPFRRLDFRLEGDEHVDVTDPGSLRAGLAGADVVVNSVDYRFNL